MVAQENVTMVVTTCNLTEGNKVKCAKFWPCSESDIAKRIDNDMSVVADGEQ